MVSLAGEGRSESVTGAGRDGGRIGEVACRPIRPPPYGAIVSVMCFEFSQAFAGPTAVAHFGVAEPPPPAFQPAPNLFPKKTVAAVGVKGDGKTRGLGLFSWGLVPSWANEPGKDRPFNARS